MKHENVEANWKIIISFCQNDDVRDNLSKKQIVEFLKKRFELIPKNQKYELQDNTKSIPS